jgi:hypothetical protein
MNSKRFFAAALFLLVALPAICFAQVASPVAQPAAASAVSSDFAPSGSALALTLPGKLAEGPGPVPLCPPEEPVCPDLPKPKTVSGTPLSALLAVVSLPGKLAEGPGPVPLCPPEEPVCPDLPKLKS